MLCDSGEGSEIMPQNVRRLSKPVNMAAVSRIMNETVLDTVIKDSSDPDFDPRRDIHYDDPRR